MNEKRFDRMSQRKSYVQLAQEQTRRRGYFKAERGNKGSAVCGVLCVFMLLNSFTETSDRENKLDT